LCKLKIYLPFTFKSSTCVAQLAASGSLVDSRQYLLISARMDVVPVEDWMTVQVPGYDRVDRTINLLAKTLGRLDPGDDHVTILLEDIIGWTVVAYPKLNGALIDRDHRDTLSQLLKVHQDQLRDLVAKILDPNSGSTWVEFRRLSK
jgi:hypothetical protein